MALTQILARYPEHIEARLALGYSYLNEAPAGSLEYAWKVLGQAGHNPHAFNLLSAAYAKMRDAAKTIEEEAKIRIHEVDAYQEILQHVPDWPEVIFRSASQRIAIQRLVPERINELHQAIAELDTLLVLLDKEGRKTEQVSVHFQLGRAYKHLEDAQPQSRRASTYLPTNYKLALEEFSTALKSNPERVDALGEIVLVYKAIGDRSSAVKHVHKHIPNLTQNNTIAKAYEMLGALQVESGHLTEAINSFKKALTHNAYMMGSYLHLASLYQQTGNTTKAITILEKSVEVEPGFLRGNSETGHIYMAMGRYKQAITAFEKVIQTPTSEAIVIGMLPSRHQYKNKLYYKSTAALAWLFLETNKPNKALNMAELAARYQPMDVSLLDTMGTIYDVLDKQTEAIEAFQQAINLANLPSAHYHLAEIYVRKNKLKIANEHLTAALTSGEDFYYRKAAEKLQASVSEELL
ncbi:MAG: tetratricopeptide repeat protein [Pseudomonadales bacterium]